MAVVLLTGNPGSGKTSVAQELLRRGLNAVDADEIAGWQTSAGVDVTEPTEVSDEWLLAHRWVWPRRRLTELVDANADGERLLICGIAMNQRELLDLFDVVFLLSIDPRTQVERLDTPANAGRNAVQRRQILEGLPIFEGEMKAAGAVVLDGAAPTAAVVDRLLRDLDGRNL